jgi:hypothetical protein
MTTAIVKPEKKTVVEFLTADPNEHPDFVPCYEERPYAGEHLVVPMPNLVALVRRFGGWDAIPDGMDKINEIDILSRDEAGQSALLKMRNTGRICGDFSRLGADILEVDDWHPKERHLSILFAVPADWAAGPWGVACVSISDSFSASAELDALAAAACDLYFGMIQKATETYCHIRRDQFIF